MQSVPRFSVSHQRPIPDLNPIRSKASDENKDADMLDVQIKINAEILKRIDTLEDAKKDVEAKMKILQAECAKYKKQSAFYKTKLYNVKVDPKADAKADQSKDKENLNESGSNGQA